MQVETPLLKHEGMKTNERDEAAIHAFVTYALPMSELFALPAVQVLTVAAGREAGLARETDIMYIR
jgi:hypothetical protein